MYSRRWRESVRKKSLSESVCAKQRVAAKLVHMVAELASIPFSKSEFGIAEPVMGIHPPRVIALACSTRPIQVYDYFNGLEQLISLQHEYPGEAFYVISDNDKFARNQSPGERREAIVNVASACLALGLDEKKAVLYRQSDLPQALQLLWSMPCGVVTQTEQGMANTLAHSEANYLPVDQAALFAANGLVIRGTIMVGQAEQISGFQYARDLAQMFNHRYGQQVLTCPGARLVGLQHAPGNFSSLADSTLSPFACRKELEERLSQSFADAKRPATAAGCRATLLYLHRNVCSDINNRLAFEEQLLAGREYHRLTRLLAADIESYFSTAATRYARLKENFDYVWDVLREGAYLASLQADRTLVAVRQAIGVV
jgi:tryptophanyl-tRNA synthetase